MDKPMPLCHALTVLAAAYTSTEDGKVVVQAPGFSDYPYADCVEAWGVVRRAVGLPTEVETPEQPEPDNWVTLTPTRKFSD